MHGNAFNWLSFVPGLDVHEYGHVFLAVLIMALLLIFTLIARLQLNAAIKREDQGLVPDSKLTIRNFFEIIAEALYDLAVNVMGKHNAERHFPLIATLFIFILSCNLIGMVPGLLPPTENLNTTLSFGLFVFIYYTAAGIKEGGFGYFKHFFGPVWWLAWLIFPIEIASNLFRPISLALRLRGNIMGDHVVLGVFNELTHIGIPIIFYAMGLFVCLIQGMFPFLIDLYHHELHTNSAIILKPTS